LQARPEDPTARAMLGISQYMLHDYSKALETLQPIRGHLDTFPILPLAYADSMMRAGDFLQGMQALEAIVRKDPENPAAHGALAEAYRKDGRLEEAEREDQLANKLQMQHRVTTNNAAVEENSTKKK